MLKNDTELFVRIHSFIQFNQRLFTYYHEIYSIPFQCRKWTGKYNWNVKGNHLSIISPILLHRHTNCICNGNMWAECYSHGNLFIQKNRNQYWYYRQKNWGAIKVRYSLFQHLFIGSLTKGLSFVLKSREVCLGFRCAYSSGFNARYSF